MGTKVERNLRSFLAYAGDAPYRELILEQVQKVGKEDLSGAGVFERSVALPAAIRAYEAASPLPAAIRAKTPMPSFVQIDIFFESLNVELMANKSFWRINSCADAAAAILTIANQHFGLGLVVDSRGGDSNAEQELAFTLFQMATVSFACAAVDQPEVRERMGIESASPQTMKQFFAPEISPLNVLLGVILGLLGILILLALLATLPPPV